MKLKILGSGSSGNCYLLQSKDEVLIIECGTSWKQVKEALDFNYSNVVGCLISHEHGDHAKHVPRVINAGIDIYTSKGTKEELGLKSHRTKEIEPLSQFKLGAYTIMPFETNHDAKEPLGFLIQHEEMGTMFFATDTYYVEYKFDNLNHILVECNYDKELINKNVENGIIPKFLGRRIVESHFELGNVKEFLKANDLSLVENIVLLHLSGTNSDPDRFRKEIKELTAKEVYVASKNKVIDLRSE